MLQVVASVPLVPSCALSSATRSLSVRTCHWVAFCVARDFGLEPGALFGPTRGAPRIAFARQVAMYLAHIGFALSFGAISRAFDRDRTTVAHACRVVEDGRDEFRLDLRLEALELFCRAGWGALLQTTPEFAR